MKKYLKLIWSLLLSLKFLTLMLIIIALTNLYFNNYKNCIIDMLFVLWVCFERVIDILKDNKKLNK